MTIPTSPSTSTLPITSAVTLPPSPKAKAGAALKQLICAGSGPFATVRVASSIWVLSAYVVATQLSKQGYLNSFGLPMAAFGSACVANIAAACITLIVSDCSSTTHNKARFLSSMGTALSLCGSFGFFTHWMLSRRLQTDTPALHVMVPITFAFGACIKLLTETQGASPGTLNKLGVIAATGMVFGAILFQHAAWVRMEDRVLFGLASELTLCLLPNMALAWKNLITSVKNSSP